MKKLITILSLIFVVGVISVSAQCGGCAHTKKCGVEKCETNKTVATHQQKTDAVKAYYFHATHRCATCEAVETVSEEAIKEFYGGQVSFESINSEVEKNNPLIKKYKISGQTLLIVGKKKQVNLTNDAFLYARTNPDKLKSKIKSTIDSML
jgi:hypothetical protein